jgi:integrase
MKFGKDVYDNFNYLDLEKSNLIFNVYKTSGKYGQYISKIPKDLETILKEYVKEHNLEDGDFLFYSNPSGALKTKNRSYASHAFSKVVSDAFLKIGKKIDINAIRHAYATHVLKDRISQTELQKVASAMGTSRSELYETYNKLDLE